MTNMYNIYELTYIYVNIFANIYVEYNTEHLKEIEERFTKKLDVLETDYKRQINALTEQIEAQVCIYIYICIYTYICIYKFMNI
jgi:hypothetical protein